MTKNVAGLIIYTADGYMSAQMQIPGQKNFDGSTEAQWAEAGKRYFAYSGPYYISNNESQQVLRHNFEVCITPNRVGEVELRSHRFEEDDEVLVLGGAETVNIKGEERVPVLTWRRAPNNVSGIAPAVLPEIRIG